MNEYTTDWNEETGYSPLYRPNGSLLTTLTEPEDREWGRDLRPVVEELNILYRLLLAERQQGGARPIPPSPDES